MVLSAIDRYLAQEVEVHASAGKREARDYMKTQRSHEEEGLRLNDASNEKLKDWIWITFFFHVSRLIYL